MALRILDRREGKGGGSCSTPSSFLRLCVVRKEASLVGLEGTGRERTYKERDWMTEKKEREREHDVMSIGINLPWWKKRIDKRRGEKREKEY